MLFIRWGLSTGDRGGSGAVQSENSQSERRVIHWESLLEKTKGRHVDREGKV